MSETSMVVELVNHEEQYALVSSPKTTVKFKVHKPRRNFHFFKIGVDKGNIPTPLAGDFSTLDTALKALKFYLDNYDESFAVRSERLHKERQERHASKANSSNGK